MLVLSLGDSQDFMLLINRSPKEHQLLIQNPEYLSYQDLVDHTTYPNRNDELQINLPAQTGILLSAKLHRITCHVGRRLTHKYKRL